MPRLTRAFADAGLKLDMGKSCIRFSAATDVPLETIGELIAEMPPDLFIERYEAAKASGPGATGGLDPHGRSGQSEDRPLIALAKTPV